MPNDQKFMQRALDMAHVGVQKGQTPFGACIVRNNKVICCVHNHVWKNTDITAHAEVYAIREACRKLRTIDLSGCVIYSTCEPCPMCFSAIHWARIQKIVLGASIRDAKKIGFNELYLSNQKMKKLGKSPVKIVSGCLRKECVALMQSWFQREDRRAY